MGQVFPRQKTVHISMQVAAIFCLMLVAVYGAYTVIADPEQVDQRSDTVQAAPTVAPLPATLSSIKDASEIQQLAAADVPGAKIQSIKLEQFNNTLAYSVRLSDGRLRYYDATTGSLLSEQNQSGFQPTENAIPDGYVASITIDQARSIAIERIPLEEVANITLEIEKGQPVYCVFFTGGSKVLVSAIDGSVASVYVHNETAQQPTQEPIDPTPSEKSAAAQEPNDMTAQEPKIDQSASTLEPVATVTPVPTPNFASIKPLEGAASGEAVARNMARSSDPDKTIDHVELLYALDNQETYAVWFTDGSVLSVQAFIDPATQTE